MADNQFHSMRACLYFSICLALFSVVGCKPKPVQITGQVFIVTQSADNVKLGDVEIILVEKSQVTEFLQNKQAVVESVMAARQKEMADAEQIAAKSRADYTLFSTIKNSRPDLDDPPEPYTKPLSYTGALRFSKYALNDYSIFFGNSFFSTNVGCIKLKSQIKVLWPQQQALAKPIDFAGAQLQSALRQGLVDVDKVNALSGREDALREQWNQKSAEIDSLLSELEVTLDRKIAEEKAAAETAELLLEIAKKKLVSSPTTDDYFNDFLPVVVQKTRSDADGKFSFTYPRDKPLVIYAGAQRAVPNGTEKYCWVIDAPIDSETTQVFLSNNNLVFVDPNGYFKLKPRQ